MTPFILTRFFIRKFVHFKFWIFYDSRLLVVFLKLKLIFLYSNDGTTLRKKIFLVDYGLASRYTYLGFHKPFEPDARSAHEGTLEYTSRDAHLGCVSRRGDFEVLLYTLIDWLGGKLPWDTDEGLKPPAIQKLKIEAFHDIKEFLAKTFKDNSYPTFLEDLMIAVKKLPFEETPDYNYFRSLFQPYTETQVKSIGNVQL